MARTEVSPQATDSSGVAEAYTAGIADGHKFRNDVKTMVRIVNGSGAATRDVTFQTPGTVDGNAVADKTVTLGISAEMTFSLIPGVYNQSDGMVYIDYDSGNESDLSIAVIRAS